MSLQFVTGSSGAGKSYTVYKDLIEESIAHPEKQFLVIVPDQFTMQTQKEIVRMHPKRGLMNLDVLSFNRLAWRVFEETGGNTLPVLEDTGKSLIVQRIINAEQKNLKLLGRTLTRQGAAEQMKSLISELLQYRVKPEDLETWVTKERRNGLLAMKLEDIRVIYQAFLEYLKDNYLTAEEVPEILCSVIGESELVRGSVVVLDGFTGFTPVQNEVVTELLRLAEKVRVVVTIDPAVDAHKRGGKHHLFHMSREMIRRTTELARNAHAEILPDLVIREGAKSRFAGSQPLAFLEKNLFRFGGGNVFAAEQNDISVCDATDPREETAYIVRQIHRLVREKGYHYRDFAILTGDLDTYGRLSEQMLTEAEIPCFLDQKQSVMANPLIEMIRAALDMVAQNYSYETVFRYLRSGLSGFTREEIDEMENYCLALGIRGRKRYEEKWVRTPHPKEDKGERLDYLNALRERFVSTTAALHAGLHERNSTVRRKTEVLYLFLTACGTEENLRAFSRRFEEAGDHSHREYDQIYPWCMDLLNKLVEVLGEEKMKLADYVKILDAGFAEGRIGLIPPGEDQVMIGDIERTRLKQIRVLFFCGINEGIVPRQASTRGILSEPDREALERAEVELAPTAREDMYRQRFYLYLAMTKPMDRLCLSYSTTDREGQALLPSYLTGVIKRLFPKIRVFHPDTEETAAERMETGKGQMDYLLSELQTIGSRPLSAEATELINAMRRDPAQSETAQALLAAAALRNPENGIGRAAAAALYGENMINSITRLEAFSGCAFAHFCNYGLRLRERDTFEFRALDFGNIMHDALDKFSGSIKKQHLEWKGLPDETREKLADQALDEVVEGYGNQIMRSTERNAHMIARIRKMLQRTVWALQKQVEKGDFRPADFEFRFDDTISSLNFRLGENARMKLTGKIDRMDLCDEGDKHYVKIIDYKTGGTQFDMNKLYNGLQLQLMVYLNAAVEEEQKKHADKLVEPAGVFYYHIDDPLADAGVGDIPEEILKMLRPDGLLRRENSILDHFDEGFSERRTSDVIGVSLRKDGMPTQNSEPKLADAENFALIRQFAGRKVTEIGTDIRDGVTRADPYRYGKDTPCTFCAYKSVCGFDEKIGGYGYRRITKKDTADVLADMREDLKKWE
ncbi:MAG: helicase-exonuclease AddAB subunit AddB [Eubacterium sp.]|nr:helicase-exonuclease AddAB subunit AddB [Eubacterium sp.]